MKFFSLLSFVALSPAVATASTWNVDTAHTSARFSVRHMMVTNVHGQFSGVTGTLVLDDDDITQSKVDISIDATTVDTRDAKRDAHLKSADFFDVANHPTMTFTSKRVRRAGKGKLQIVGDLTMRGVTKEVTLMTEGPTDPVLGPWGNYRVGFSATTEIDRKDFNVSWNKKLDKGGVVVSDTVKIQIDAEFMTKNDPNS